MKVLCRRFVLQHLLGGPRGLSAMRRGAAGCRRGAAGVPNRERIHTVRRSRLIQQPSRKRQPSFSR